MKTLVVLPMQEEMDGFVKGCSEQGLRVEEASTGRLFLVRFPDLGITVARGGLGKAQFGVQTQHLLEACPDCNLVICAGGAGALVDDLAIGDVVVATETVEHDIRNRFGRPLLPRFGCAEAVVSDLRSVPTMGEAFRVHFGPVASGDEDVVDTERKRALHERTGALAVAWEGAGGARACRFNDTPFVEIRGITDAADSDAPSEYAANLDGAMRNVASVVVRWAGRARQR